MHMKKILAFLLFLLCVPAYSAQVVNVEYIHNAIAQKWDITIPYNPELANPRVAANMKYLLTVVDVANEMLNGGKWTDYGNGEYATMIAADTVATDGAVDNLVKSIDWHFFIKTTDDTTGFSLKISTKGTFYVNWGDGTIETINKQDVENITYSHTYAESGAYDISIAGRATAYSNVSKTAAISFAGNKKLAQISGSLGAIFPTISSKSQPRFYQTFSNCTMLEGGIPENLFNGVSGKPASTMFVGLFANCGKLTGSIPENLFAGLSGAPSYQLFNNTFLNCSGLTGPIPGKLFAGISGSPTEYLFDSTFSGCSGLSGEIPADLFRGVTGTPLYAVFYRTFSGCGGLTGAIPENLFSGIYGAPSGGMFYYTFFGCKGLTSIPENLFGDISGTAKTAMFAGMFSGCTGLQGESAKINGRYLYNIWPDAISTQVDDMYYNATGLDDYNCIPSSWGGGGKNCLATDPT